MGNGQDRRIAKRSYGRFTVRVTIEARADGNVCGQASGWLTDASFSGCRLVCVDLPLAAHDKLLSGEWNVRVATHSPRDGADLVVTGKVKWLEPHPQMSRQMTLGLQYLVAEAHQPKLAELLHEQNTSAKPSWPWVAAGVVTLAVGLSWWSQRHPAEPSVTAHESEEPRREARNLTTNKQVRHELEVKPAANTVNPTPVLVGGKPRRGAPSLDATHSAPRSFDASNLAPLASESAELQSGVLTYRAALVYPAPATTLWKVAVIDTNGRSVEGCSRVVQLATGASEFAQSCEPTEGEWVAPFSVRVTPMTPKTKYLALPQASP